MKYYFIQFFWPFFSFYKFYTRLFYNEFFLKKKTQNQVKLTIMKKIMKI